jgi:thioredoxin reductase (NADPH)
LRDVVTAEEIGEIAVFAALGPAEREELSRGAADVSLVSGDQLATRPNISTMFGTEVADVHGDVSLEAIDVRDVETGEISRLESGGLYIFIGADAQTEWLPPEIARDERGYLLTGSDMRAANRWTQDRDPYLLETSVPGVFACGDVRFSPVKRVAAAVGEGSMAIAFVHQYLRDAGAPD